MLTGNRYTRKKRITKVNEPQGTCFYFKVDLQLPQGYLSFEPYLTLRYAYRPVLHIPGEHWVWFEEDIIDRDGQKAKDLALALAEAYSGTILITRGEDTDQSDD